MALIYIETHVLFFFLIALNSCPNNFIFFVFVSLYLFSVRFWNALDLLDWSSSYLLLYTVVFFWLYFQHTFAHFNVPVLLKFLFLLHLEFPKVFLFSEYSSVTALLLFQGSSRYVYFWGQVVFFSLFVYFLLALWLFPLSYDCLFWFLSFMLGCLVILGFIVTC